MCRPRCSNDSCRIKKYCLTYTPDKSLIRETTLQAGDYSPRLVDSNKKDDVIYETWACPQFSGKEENE